MPSARIEQLRKRFSPLEIRRRRHEHAEAAAQEEERDWQSKKAQAESALSDLEREKRGITQKIQALETRRDLINSDEYELQSLHLKCERLQNSLEERRRKQNVEKAKIRLGEEVRPDEKYSPYYLEQEIAKKKVELRESVASLKARNEEIEDLKTLLMAATEADEFDKRIQAIAEQIEILNAARPWLKKLLGTVTEEQVQLLAKLEKLRTAQVNVSTMAADQRVTLINQWQKTLLKAKKEALENKCGIIDLQADLTFLKNCPETNLLPDDLDKITKRWLKRLSREVAELGLSIAAPDALFSLLAIIAQAIILSQQGYDYLKLPPQIYREAINHLTLVLASNTILGATLIYGSIRISSKLETWPSDVYLGPLKRRMKSHRSR
ncbi:MAG: hypothetical protein PVJ09_02820 [Candidatus Woesebacteria bacterium]|jgi:hypothetical protein